ncbi:MAG: peptide-methionine (S)-S-oxide reductase, partial [Planctomycetia bacterium]
MGGEAAAVRGRSGAARYNAGNLVHDPIPFEEPTNMTTRVVWFFSVLFLAGAITMSSGLAAAEGELAKATFAGGCFWCTEAVYAQIKGV